MIYQPAIFDMEYPDARLSSSIILVYSVTIRWLCDGTFLLLYLLRISDRSVTHIQIRCQQL